MDYVKYIRDKIGTAAINLVAVNVIIINNNNEVLLQKNKEIKLSNEFTVEVYPLILPLDMCLWEHIKGKLWCRVQVWDGTYT